MQTMLVRKVFNNGVVNLKMRPDIAQSVHLWPKSTASSDAKVRTRLTTICHCPQCQLECHTLTQIESKAVAHRMLCPGHIISYA